MAFGKGCTTVPELKQEGRTFRSRGGELELVIELKKRVVKLCF